MTMKAMSTRVYNPEFAEVVYTEDGRTLPGHSHGEAPTGDKVATALLANGRLIEPNLPTLGGAPTPGNQEPPVTSKRGRSVKTQEDTK